MFEFTTLAREGLPETMASGWVIGILISSES